jgi:hypothetical protein
VDLIRSITLMAMALPALVFCQQGGPPRPLTPYDLDNLVARIALYPDSLLSQVLAAATYPEEIADARRWADQHSHLKGDALARAIQEDQLPWDPSVQALLPFPTVLNMMANDMNWTSALGNAFLSQKDAVMDAVQRKRHEATDFGYLHGNAQLAVVTNGGYIEINPVNPLFVPVPIYDPAVVFIRPRVGFAVGGAITFGGVALTVGFAPWGWGHTRFDWGGHRVIINEHPWDRRWDNRREYVHPYENVRRFDRSHRPVERHEIHERRQ